MSNWPARLLIAQWEVRRFIKPKQLFLSFVMTLVFGAVCFGVGKWAEGSKSTLAPAAITGGRTLGIRKVDTPSSLVRIPALPSHVDSLRRALIARDIHGILIVRSADTAQLIVRRSPAWLGALETRMNTRSRLPTSATGRCECCGRGARNRMLDACTW